MADEASPYRLEALATLPVFFKLAGRSVLVAGGGVPAVWKAELLVATGATIRVYDAAPCPEMVALAGHVADGRLTLANRLWTAQDFLNTALAIGAIEDEGEAEAFVQAARTAGVPVNVIDKPAYCDFQFGTIVARSPVLIGISTDGAAPVFGQALRARIEAVLPQHLQRWAEAARAWRPMVQARSLDFRHRRRFWERFSELALSGHGDPTQEALEDCLATIDEAPSASAGRVILVGAGPGTPDTLTLQAVAALQSADVVVFDPDVAEATVGFARREAAKLVADSSALPQAAEHVRAGRVVAWLGTGNPISCARWQDHASIFAGSGPVTRVAGLNCCPACPAGCRYPTSLPAEP